MPVESAETQAKSYRYLRIAMVGLLLALAAAVFYQSSRQGGGPGSPGEILVGYP
jgi:hypothetical protein